MGADRHRRRDPPRRLLTDGGDHAAGTGSFYGRRKGKRLRPAQASRLDDLLPRLAIDLAHPVSADLRDLFPRVVRAVRLEIGIGAGEHLVHEATNHPDVGFIACEPFVNGLAQALRKIEAAGLDTVRLHAGDAQDLLEALPDASLVRVDLLYPDPWPKRRHWKRRFVSDANVARLARVIAPGGELRMATDVADYAAWMLRHVRASPAFGWTARRADDWRIPWGGWPGTRYEAKAKAEGRAPTYLVFRREG